MGLSSLYGKGLRVWIYSLKDLGWVGYSTIQGVKKRGGTGMIAPKGISGRVGGPNWIGSVLFIEGYLSIYYFIRVSSSARSFYFKTYCCSRLNSSLLYI